MWRMLRSAIYRPFSLFAALFLVACGGAVPDPTPVPERASPTTAARPTVTAVPIPTSMPTSLPTPAPTTPPTATPLPEPSPGSAIVIETPLPGASITAPADLRATVADAALVSRMAYRVYDARGAQIGAGLLQPLNERAAGAILEFNAGVGGPGRIEVVALDGGGAPLARTSLSIQLAPSRPPELPATDPPHAPIVIEAPLSGTVITGQVELRGSVARMPFEGNLAYRIYDVAGTLVARGALMVIGEMAGPGRFDERIALPTLRGPARIELIEVNEMDGSFAASATVEVVIGEDYGEGIIVETPFAGATLAGGDELRGTLSTTPADGRLAYRIYDATGLQVGAGSLRVEGGPGGPGRFSGRLAFSAGMGGPGRLEVVAPSSSIGVQVTLAPAAAGGVTGPAPSLILSAPRSGASLDGSIELRGTTSLTPYTGNLVYRIYNKGGLRIASGPVWVAGNPAGPGDFAEPLDLAGLPGLRGPVRIEIVELNPADGAPVAGVTVEVVVQ